MNKISATECSLQIVGLSTQVVLSEDIWRQFGFKKIPKRGRIFNKFVNANKLCEEKTFSREIFLISIAYGFKYFKRNNSKELCLKMFYKMMEELIENSMVYFSFGFVDNYDMYNYFNEGINEYIEKDFENMHILLLERLNGKTSTKANWLVGSMQLDAYKNVEGFINDNLGEYQEILENDIILK